MGGGEEHMKRKMSNRKYFNAEVPQEDKGSGKADLGKTCEMEMKMRGMYG